MNTTYKLANDMKQRVHEEQKADGLTTHPLCGAADDVVVSVNEDDALLVHKRHLVGRLVHCANLYWDWLGYGKS
jgi:hypothetical protein